MLNDNLVEQLNKNLADLQVMYVKLHNYHWNVKGKHFFGIHNMTEGYYNYFAEQYDEVAERILQIGGKPITTMKSYLENSEIKEEEKNEFSADDVINSIVKDFNYLKNQFANTSKVAEENNDPTTQTLAEDNMAWMEKAVWMLNASK